MKKGFFMVYTDFEREVFSVKAPNVGDEVYVPSEAFCRHGIGDQIGGRATVSAVTTRRVGDEVVPFVTVSVFPCRHYDWRRLSQEQDELKRIFKGEYAYVDVHGLTQSRRA